MTDAPEWTPLVINCRGSVGDALQARRIQLGLTFADVDHRAGLQDGYSAKLCRSQTPQGRKGVHFKAVHSRSPAGDIVMTGASEFLHEALDLRLVIIDSATAERIGAIPAPRHSPLSATGSPALYHSRKRDEARTMSCGQWEAASGAKITRDLLQISVVAHPYIAEDPVLRAEAEAIEALLGDLYARIRASD
jgi:hypothetical protein